MKTFSKKPIQSILGLLAASLMIFAIQINQINAQTANTGNVCLITTNTSASVNSVLSNCKDCGNCIVTVVGSNAFYVKQGGKAGNNLKVTGGNNAVKAEDISKMPGLAAFRPFRGNDDIQISCGTNTLIFHGNEGTSSENPLDLCDDNGNQQCANPNTWSVTNNDPESNDSYTIQPNNDPTASLCYAPSTGLTIRKQAHAPKENSRNPDVCTLWCVTPTALGVNGEIIGYKITPRNHPDYVLAANTSTNKIMMKKVSTSNQDAAEIEKGVMAHWTFKSKATTAPASNQRQQKQSRNRN